MPVCTKNHFVKHGDKKPVQVPCYFIAGICVTDPRHEGGLNMFLRSTYPYHHSSDYAKSKQAQSMVVPNNLIVANYNEEKNWITEWRKKNETFRQLANAS